MEVIGEITTIIYQNKINSYTVAEIETDEEILVIVGYLPFVNVGDTVKLIGKYVEHKDYGRQFKVDTFEKIMPQTLSALEKYLASGKIKGIRKATAKKIIKEFGEDTINIFRLYPEKLAQIKGISLEKAKEMSESFIENWEVWQIVGFLEKFGIGAEYATKVFELYGITAIDEIENNPYLLIDIARGVDFKQVDKMALDLGISSDNEKRVTSGIKYGLIRVTNNGHSCTLKDNLIEFVINLLDVTSENVEDGIISLKSKDEIVEEKRENGDVFVYLKTFYITEEEIAYKIKRLLKAKNVKEIKSFEKELKKVEKISNIELSEKQKQALKLINENNVTIITGGPGTGKTTIIKNIIDIYEEKGKKVVLAAPTGRAAKRMTETTGKDASTLHRLLEIGKIDDDSFYKSVSKYEGAPIDADVIIVDEVSMMDMFLMNYLLKCVYQGTKLVLVGDIDQLPSVGPGSVLKDLINSEEIPTIKLDKIFRQAARSKIIVNAHRVNEGEKFLSKSEEEEEMKEDFFFIKETSQEKMLSQIVSLCTGRLEKYGNYDFFQNIQVLTPTKKGMLGTKELNKVLQENLNPNLIGLPERASTGAIYRAGDRVMQIKNNYDIYWEREKGEEKEGIEEKRGIEEKEIGSGVFNGEIGTIIKVDEKEKVVEIKFDDDKIAYYEYSELDQIEHSYAITIHKAQRK